MASHVDITRLRPWASIAPNDLEIVRAIYQHSLESSAGVPEKQVRFELGSTREDLRRLVKLELVATRSEGLLPTVLGLTYLEEAADDLAVLAKLVAFAHEQYRPSEEVIPLEKLKASFQTEEIENPRIRALGSDLYLQFDANGGLRPSEYNWDHPDFPAAFLERYKSHFTPERLRFDDPAPEAFALPFVFCLTGLRAVRFRALRDTARSHWGPPVP